MAESQMIQQELQRDDQTLQTIGQIDAQIQSIYNNLEALSVQTNPDVNKQNALLQQIQQSSLRYFSFFEDVATASSIREGFERITHDVQSEAPDVINHSVYKEIAL